MEEMNIFSPSMISTQQKKIASHFFPSSWKCIRRQMICDVSRKLDLETGKSTPQWKNKILQDFVNNIFLKKSLNHVG